MSDIFKDNKYGESTNEQHSSFLDTLVASTKNPVSKMITNETPVPSPGSPSFIPPEIPVFDGKGEYLRAKDKGQRAASEITQIVRAKIYKTSSESRKIIPCMVDGVMPTIGSHVIPLAHQKTLKSAGEKGKPLLSHEHATDLSSPSSPQSYSVLPLFCSCCDANIFEAIENGNALDIANGIPGKKFTKQMGLLLGRALCGQIYKANKIREFSLPQNLAKKSGVDGSDFDFCFNDISGLVISHLGRSHSLMAGARETQTQFPVSLFMLQYTTLQLNLNVKHFAEVRQAEFFHQIEEQLNATVHALGIPISRISEEAGPVSNIQEHLSGAWNVVVYEFEKELSFACANMVPYTDDGNDEIDAQELTFDDLAIPEVAEFVPFFAGTFHTPNRKKKKDSRMPSGYLFLAFPSVPLLLKGQKQESVLSKALRSLVEKGQLDQNSLLENIWGLLPHLMLGDNFIFAAKHQAKIDAYKAKIFDTEINEMHLAFRKFLGLPLLHEISTEAHLKDLQADIFQPDRAYTFTIHLPNLESTRNLEP